MVRFNLPGLQFHFSESKGSGKGAATLDVILLNNEELLRAVRLNASSDLCPAAHPNSLLGKRGGSLRQRWIKRKEKPMKMKITQHSHKWFLHNKGHNPKKTCKNRARDAKAKTRRSWWKSRKQWRRLSLEQDGRRSQTCPLLREASSHWMSTVSRRDGC